MISLITIPEDLVSSVLADWLIIVDVSHLDSAFCSSALRKVFCAVAYDHARTTLTYPTNLEYRCEACDKINTWVLHKGVRLVGIYVTGSFVEDAARREEYLTKCGHNLLWVQIGSELPVMEVLNYCSNLQRLSILGDADEALLTRVAQCCPLLHDLTLHESSVVPASFTNLKRLSLMTRADVHEQSILELIRCNTGLVSYKSRRLGVDGIILREVALRCNFLTELSIHGVSALRDKIFDEVSGSPALPVLETKIIVSWNGATIGHCSCG
jgi:hypothetical protein